MADRVTFSLARSGRALLCAVALGGSALSVAPPALAQDVSGAASAYSRGQQADLTGDHSTAAELYELANSLAPSPEALRSALRARKAAGQLAISAGHAEALLELYPDDAKSTEAAEELLTEAKAKLVRYVIECKPKACNVVVDDAAVTTVAKKEHVIYVEPGEHAVSASFGTMQTDRQQSAGEAGEEKSLTFAAPAESRRPKRFAAGTGQADVMSDMGPAVARGGGLSPAFFITGVIVTAGLAGASVWSGIDTLDAHESYRSRRTSEQDLASGRAEYEDGKDKQLRTNILIGAAAGAAVLTGVLAFVTDWGGKTESAAKTPRLQMATHPITAGGAMSLKGSF
jgi:hypothetical protein